MQLCSKFNFKDTSFDIFDRRSEQLSEQPREFLFQIKGNILKTLSCSDFYYQFFVICFSLSLGDIRWFSKQN